MESVTTAEVLQTVVLTPEVIRETDLAVLNFIGDYNYAAFNEIVDKHIDDPSVQEWIKNNVGVVERYADWNTLRAILTKKIIQIDGETQNTDPRKYGFFYSIVTFADYMKLINEWSVPASLELFAENEMKMVRKRLWNSWDAVPEYVVLHDRHYPNTWPEMDVASIEKKQLDEIFGNDDYEKSNGTFADNEQLKAVLQSGFDELLTVTQVRNLLDEIDLAKNIFALQAIADLLKEFEKEPDYQSLVDQKARIPANILIHTIYNDSPRLINRVFDIVSTLHPPLLVMDSLFNGADDEQLSNLSPSNAAKLSKSAQVGWISKYFGRLRTIDNFKNRLMDAEAWPANEIVPYLRRISTVPFFEPGIWKYLIDFRDDNVVHGKLINLFNQAHPTLGNLFYVHDNAILDVVLAETPVLNHMAKNLPSSSIQFESLEVQRYDGHFLAVLQYFAGEGRDVPLESDTSYVNKRLREFSVLNADFSGLSIADPIDWKKEQRIREMIDDEETPDDSIIQLAKLLKPI